MAKDDMDDWLEREQKRSDEWWDKHNKRSWLSHKAEGSPVFFAFWGMILIVFLVVLGVACFDQGIPSLPYWLTPYWRFVPPGSVFVAAALFWKRETLVRRDWMQIGSMALLSFFVYAAIPGAEFVSVFVAIAILVKVFFFAGKKKVKVQGR